MKKILIIDAEIDCLNALSNYLRSAGYEAITTTHASIGLEKAKEADLIILAVELPDQNGFVVCSQLKRNPETSNIPVLITSSAETSAVFEQHLHLANHADGYYLKPLDVQTLLQEIQAIFANMDGISAAAEAAPQAEMIDVNMSEMNIPSNEASETIKSLSADDMNLFSDIDTNELMDAEGDSFDTGGSIPSASAVEVPSSAIPASIPAPSVPSPATSSVPPIGVPKPLPIHKFSTAASQHSRTGLNALPPRGLKSAIPGVPKPSTPSSVLPRVPLSSAHGPESAAPAPSFSSLSQTAIPAADLARLTDEITVLKNEITALKSEITARDNRITMLQSQCDALTSRCENAENISRALQTEAEEAIRLKNDSENAIQNINAVKAELDTAINNTAALQQKLTEAGALAQQILTIIQHPV